MIQYFQYLNQPTQQYKIITGQALEYRFEGNLLQYRSIPYKGLNNYFFPEEMITFDYRSFYTSVFIKTNNEAILKYNYLTEETKIYDIRNSVCDSCFLRFGGMAKDPNGYLIVAHNISVPNQQDSFYRKVQVIKWSEGNMVKGGGCCKRNVEGNLWYTYEDRDGDQSGTGILPGR
ncbi:MAG: hypothetical protein IPI30_18155 [Saprospiraceae bacterium]|nr:hypothetical protein [Candidatus Vicinibacter affinis]